MNNVKKIKDVKFETFWGFDEHPQPFIVLNYDDGYESRISITDAIENESPLISKLEKLIFEHFSYEDFKNEDE